MFKNPIIPIKPYYFGEQDSWNYKAICIFASTGFFLGEDTYYNGLKVLQPATELSSDGINKRYFQWHYSPRDITLQQATEEFSVIFETIIKEQTKNAKIILPLSGGLDSRTQAAALKRLGTHVQSYSYEFQDGYPETTISEKIAKIQSFPFEKLVVKPGYLWECIDQLAKINGCYSEFTHPRQMAFLNQYANMGDLFSLGHWGDVLFDDMGVADNLTIQEQVEIILKKIIKKGGRELAESLWEAWGLEGKFYDYIRSRVEKLLHEIDIPHSANARIRAFKSLYWAPRWTSVNLSVFEAVRPISLPYYDNRMCEFICTVPEKHLAARQIQVEYLKRYAPKLAAITWQDQRPFNLYDYHLNTLPWNLPYKILNKGHRILNQLRGRKLIQRNWELQFLGNKNKTQLKKHMFKKDINSIIPGSVIDQFWNSFWEMDKVKYAHSLSMLLTMITLKPKIKLN